MKKVLVVMGGDSVDRLFFRDVLQVTTAAALSIRMILRILSFYPIAILWIAIRGPVPS